MGTITIVFDAIYKYNAVDKTNAAERMNERERKERRSQTVEGSRAEWNNRNAMMWHLYSANMNETLQRNFFIK